MTARRIIPVKIITCVCVVTLLGAAAAPITAQTEDSLTLKSPGAARAISAGATVTPIVVGIAAGDVAGPLLVVGGLVLGPTAGYLYAGLGGEAVGPAFVRGGVLAAGIGVSSVICAVGDCDLGLLGGETGASLMPAVMVLLAGIGTVVVLAGRDIVHVGERVRIRNVRLRAVSLQPVYVPEARAMGFAATWRL